MKMTALKTAIAYESKLVKRNWLFYLFIFGVLGFTLATLIPWDKNHISWPEVMFASSIPLRGVYFLNLFQSLIVTFIVCDIQRKRKKAETREVLSVRPIENGQSFLGEFLGIVIPFLVIDLVLLTICMFINILTPNSPVNLWIYLFYFFTHALPTLVFITGLSLLVNKLVKHALISGMILIAFLYFTYNFLPKPLHGILDFRGSLLPSSFSTMVGFMHLTEYLLHRSAFLLLGISFLYFAALLTKRSPGTPGQKPYYIIPASLCLVFSLSLGYLYIQKFQTRLKNRIEYCEAFLKYNEHPTTRVLAHDITYHPEGNKFSATSQMTIQNQKKIKLDQLLLFLNPGLQIDKIESNGQPLPFHRDHQVIIIERPLNPGENAQLTITYAGNIDEDIYQINIPDDTFFSSFTWDKENYGRRRAFVSDKFTVLMPQVMWYPTAVAPVELQASKELNFTDYTLHVKNPGEMTVLSQGEPTKEGDNVTFNNLQHLTGLSLCIGKYEKRAITIDSVTVELYTYPGNSSYMKYFDEWEALKEGNPDREKNLTEKSRQCKEQIEDGKPNPYPFKYLKLIEVPSSLSFLENSSFSDNIQPEIAFFWERLCKIESQNPAHFSGDPSRDESVQDHILRDKTLLFFNQLRISNIFSNYNSSITSDTYQGIGVIFKQMINPKKSRDAMSPKALNGIAEKGLKGVISEDYSKEQSAIISLKVSHLVGYLTTITTWDSLNRFMQEFNARTRFREVNFDSFIEEFEQRFGQNIKAYMDEWYTSRQIPLLSIKDLSRKVTEDTQIIDFKVGNSSETDGIVSIIMPARSDGGNEVIQYYQSFLIKPGEYKQIIVHEGIEKRLEVTTNFSGNLPEYISFDSQESSLILSGPVPAPASIPREGITLLSKNQFYPTGEIIIDNEDENFHLIDSNNNQKRLTDLMKKEDKQDYMSLRDVKANAWSLSLSQEFHGEYVRSALVKKTGTGKFKAEWVANLPEAGTYEIFIYRPHFITYGREVCVADYQGMKNYYTVHTPEEKKEIILEVQEGDPAWVSLGTFTLAEGESRVLLDDRGVSSIEKKMRNDSMTYTQLVVADAVKWVKVK